MSTSRASVHCKTAIGAIAGGTVGGVLFGALIGFVIAFIIYKKGQKRRHPVGHFSFTQDLGSPELKTYTYAQELYGQQSQELDANRNLAELSGK